MRVVVTVHCPKGYLQESNRLVFDSLRVGFPTAKIVLIDNACSEQAAGELSRMASKVRAEIVRVAPAKPHHQIIKEMVSFGGGPIAFVDTDIVFWEKVEDWRFDKTLLAGRLMPGFICPIARIPTKPRLHTSLLWITDPAKLTRITNSFPNMTDGGGWPEFDPFRPVIVPEGSKLVRFDTMAQFSAICPGICHPFTEKELDAYDHLFCGSNIDQIPKQVDVHKWHRFPVQRGLWREQEKYLAMLQ